MIQRWWVSADLTHTVLLESQDALESLDRANSVFTSCMHGLRLSPLENSISLLHEALGQQYAVSSHLSGALLARFLQTFQLDDFQQSLKLQLEAGAIASAPESSAVPAIPAADALLRDFRRSVDFSGLDRSVQLYRDAVRLQVRPDLRQYASLNGLAAALVTRFLFSAHLPDLDESIVLYRRLLEVLSSSLRLFPLLSLAAALLMRFATSSDKQDLRDAGSLISEFSKASEDRSTLLRRARACFLHCDQPDQLDEAISLYREAVTFLPVRHPDRPSLLNDLAMALSSRFSDNRQPSDLEDAVKLYQEALRHYPTFHRSYANISENLAVDLMKMYRTTRMPDHLDSAMDAFRSAVNCESAFVSFRFNSAREWAQNAHTYHHSSALEAYRFAINLLPRFSLLGAESFRSRRSHMASITASGLFCSAASCAIQEGLFNEAVEMLESRGTFWTQALQLRTPLDDLMSESPVLGERLRDIFGKLQQSSLFETPGSQKGTLGEKERAGFQSLHDDYLSTLEKIRRLDGFHDFLLPKSVTALRSAASNGPIVLLTAAVEAGCDALVLTLNGVEHVPLPGITPIQVDTLRSLLQIALAPNGARSAFKDHIDATLENVVLPNSEQRLHAKRVPEVGQSSEDRFRVLLLTLWYHIARPVLQALNLQRTSSPPRLWWCATGPFAFLPIHAAGIYNPEDGELECVSDYVISSYTPTLSTLLLPPAASANVFKMFVAIQPEIPNEPRLGLPHTREELTAIRGCVPTEGLVTLGTPDAPTSVQAVLDQISNASIVHLACHGRQFPNDPLKSSLLLTDGALEVSQIIKQPTPHALLAFLSACETAMGDEELPDEVIHIAATMLFAGFRGVVATMWTIHDQDGPKVAKSFYHHLFHNDTTNTFSTKTDRKSLKLRKWPRSLFKCTSDTAIKHEKISALCPDTREAAHALHLAVAELRSEKNCRFQRWVPFIHLGL
ncbi:hypothetical protein AcV7_007105 [Taiwanofungus camphoratus]|nr:hypothetical protein AcV7_007105 [Antrodia cinnamomea]